MGKLTPEIIEGDDESNLASFFMDVCKTNKKLLTKEIWEANLVKSKRSLKEIRSKR